MSVSLAELAKLEGVLMAFEFSPDGKCTAYENVSPEMATMAAKYCATVTMQFKTLAGAFSGLSEQSWVPQHGWVFQGGDHTVVAGNGGYRVLFAETKKSNLNDFVKALAAETPGGS